MNLMKAAVFLSLVLSLRPSGAEEIAPISGSSYTQQVFADDFSAPVLSKKWELYKSSSVVRDGSLVGIEQKDGGHAAVHTVSLSPFSDIELDVNLQFKGSKTTNLAFNQKGFAESHAGHICRAVISPTEVILRDDKTGMFKNEIYEKSKAGQLTAEDKALLKAKEARFPVKLEAGQWYSVSIRIQGDLMQAFIDGKLVGSLRSEGIAHATKDRIGLVTPGQEMLYDNVIIKTP